MHYEQTVSTLASLNGIAKHTFFSRRVFNKWYKNIKQLINDHHNGISMCAVGRPH